MSIPGSTDGPGAVERVREAEDAAEDAAEELRFREEMIDRLFAAEPLVDLLDRICLRLRDRLPALEVGVLLHDRSTGQLWPVAAPSVSDTTRASVVAIPVAESISATGTAAALGEDVYIPDIAQHPYLPGFREKTLERGIHASWAHPLIAADGSTLGVLALHRGVVGAPDDTQRELMRRYGQLATLAIERATRAPELLRASNVDHYTGLPNRARFAELVNAVLADDAGGLGMLVIDLDGFDRAVSGRLHLELQVILGEVTARLTDLVDGEGFIGRLDTGEFAVAVSMSPSATEALADRIMRAFDRPCLVETATFYLRPSIGISHVDDGLADTGDASRLLRDAVTALSAARSEGYGRRRVYDAALRDRVLFRLEREADLRRGIEAGEFFLVYQPTLNLETGDYDRAEALVRWQHPTRGLVPPDDFIPLAEDSGLIIPLGDLVFRLAVEQARRWHALFPAIRIAVNVSATQLANPAFADEIMAVIATAGVPATMLSIEITESGLMAAPEVARSSLDRLVDTGIHAAVDDFGTGHSSLARLDEIPAAGLKIDRRFIQRMAADPVTPKVVRAVVDVARAHGLFVVAEGVEDAETLALVQQLGCHWAQGYHLSRPLDPVAAQEFLARNRRA